MAVERVESRERLAHHLVEIENHFQSRNTRGSTMHIDAIRARCEEEIRSQCQSMWVIITKVLGRMRPQVTPELLPALKSTIERCLPADLPEFGGPIGAAIRLMYPPETEGFVRVLKASSQRLQEVRQRSVFKLEMELELLIMPETPAPAGPTSQTFHFHGPVTSLQTGPYASAVIKTSLSKEDREIILRALELTIDALRHSPSVIPTSAQIIEIADEAKGELAKTNPNTTKIRSYLQGMATTIQTAGSLPNVYDAIKAALSLFGISL